MSNSVRPHRQQPTRLPRPWGSPGKNTGVGCHFLLQCMKGKSESEVAQSCPTLSDPMDCSLPGSSVHGIFQARVLEWGAIAFSTPSPGISNMSKVLNPIYEPVAPHSSLIWTLPSKPHSSELPARCLHLAVRKLPNGHVQTNGDSHLPKPAPSIVSWVGALQCPSFRNSREVL